MARFTHTVVKAAPLSLAKEGIEAEIVDLRTIKTLEEERVLSKNQ
jgi:Pyruvate/2-oxoglutarate dehydrogenase complex, dehydrogenase (E1) component, eukaryotic type, beta subunit